MKGDPFVQMGIGRTGHDIHGVPETAQGPADPPNVDPLPSAGGISTIGEQANSERLAVRSRCVVIRANRRDLQTRRPRPARISNDVTNS